MKFRFPQDQVNTVHGMLSALVHAKSQERKILPPDPVKADKIQEAQKQNLKVYKRLVNKFKPGAQWVSLKMPEVMFLRILINAAEKNKNANTNQHILSDLVAFRANVEKQIEEKRDEIDKTEKLDTK